MKVPRTAVVGVVVACLECDVHQATKYLSPELIVRATGRFHQRKNGRTSEVVLTIGKPNYRERQKIKLFKAEGEPFPVKKIQLKW